MLMLCEFEKLVFYVDVLFDWFCFVECVDIEVIGVVIDVCEVWDVVDVLFDGKVVELV